MCHRMFCCYYVSILSDSDVIWYLLATLLKWAGVPRPIVYYQG
jgi:hypothetical protein